MLQQQQQPVRSWNSSGTNLTSDYLHHLQLTLDLTRFYVLRVAALFVASVGIAANVVNILVLSKRSMKSSTNYYLCTLAVFDILFLVSAVTMTFQHQDNDVKDMHWYFRYKNICGRTFTDMASNIAIWLTITFTVERYVGVCYPMRGKLWCTTEKAKRVIPVVCLLAAALTVPEFFQYRIVSEEKLPNVTVLTRTPTAFGNSTFYHVYNHLRQSLFAFVPVLLLLIFNALLVKTVCKAATDRKTLTVRIESLLFRKQERLRRNEQAITVTLITVVLVFLVCQLPQAIQQLYAIYLDLTDQLTKERNLVLRIQGNYFNLLVMINASANFLLYSAFSYEFRRSFKRLISRRGRRPRSIESCKDEEQLRVPSRRSALRASQ